VTADPQDDDSIDAVFNRAVDGIRWLREELEIGLAVNQQVIAEYDALRTAIEFAGWTPVRQEDGSFRLEVFDGG
jgi:hypothetical protein